MARRKFGRIISFGELVKLLFRYALVGVLALIILAIVNWILGAIGGIAVFGTIILGIIVLVVYLYSLSIHPGKENILVDVIPYLIVASIIISLVNLANIQIQLAQVPGEIGIRFALAISAIFIADTAIMNVFPKLKGRKRR